MLSNKVKLITIKVLVSLAAGWAAVLLGGQAVVVDSAYGVYFVWSLIFPLIVSWAWGGYFSLISAFGGGVFLIPFLLTESYGYGNLIYSALYVLLIVAVGYLCSEKKKRLNLYLMMLMYSFLYYLSVNVLFGKLIEYNDGSHVQFFSAPVLRIQSLNNLLTLFITVLIVKILFKLPFVRMVFRLPSIPNSEKNVYSMLYIIILCIIFSAIVTAETFYFSDKESNTSILYSYDGSTLKILTFFAIVMVIIDYIIYNSMKMLNYRKQLIGREKHYRAIFYNMVDTYIEVNTQGIILCSSPSVTNTLGFTEVYVCGKPLRNFFENPEAIDAFIAECFEKQSNGNTEFVSVYYNQRRQLLVKGKVKNPSEADEIAVITLRDISDYKKAEGQRKELAAIINAIFESNKDFIWVVNGKDFTLMFCNKAFKDYILSTKGICVTSGCKAETLFTEHEAMLLHRYYLRVLEKGNFFVEFTTDDQKLILDLSLYPVKISKDNVNISVFAKDITHQREIENQIIVLNEGLEKMVAKRTQELNDAYGDLESYSYTVTHEFKTPVREIDTYMAIIEEDNKGRLLPQSVDDIHAVRKICSETLEMTQKMMMYSQAGYVVFNIEKVDMEQLVRDCFAELTRAQNIPAELKCDHLLPLETDAFMMRVAVSNILSNSFKFSRKKNRVEIDVSCRKNGDEISYYFRDHGDGFSVQDSNELFGLYNRAHTKEFEGSGIGLAVVKKICLRSGGDAEIYGEKGVGCTVVLRFNRPNNSEAFVKDDSIS